MHDRISASIRKNRETLQQRLHRDKNPDMHLRHFRTCQREATVYYVEGIVSVDYLQHYLLTPCQRLRDVSPDKHLSQTLKEAVYISDVVEAQT